MSGKPKRRIRPGPVSSAEAEERYRTLVEIAADEFFQKGFRGATLAIIARRSRISKATLYAEFPSKEALFHKVIVESLPAFRREQVEVLDRTQPFATVIRRVVELFIRSTHDERANALLRLAIAERHVFPRLAELCLENAYDMVRPLGAYMREMASPGSLDERQSVWTAFQLMSMSIGGFASVLVPPGTSEMEDPAWIDTVTRNFVQGFPLGSSAKAD